jgi:hypothetical protein
MGRRQRNKKVAFLREFPFRRWEIRKEYTHITLPELTRAIIT